MTKQAEIHAGQGGFNIEVGKNTDLKGAVISSDATPDKNKLSTDTLSYSDIKNKADYSASSSGANYDSKKYSKDDPNYKNQGLTPNIGVTANGNADSTTKSAIANGTITVKGNPNQDLSGLNRNTISALNGLGKIFDKKTVQEQQEFANLFGQEAFKAVGDLGLKEGSPEKAALDTFVGGVMSKLGGSNFASGAAGAGINQLVMNELKNIKDPAVLQWASAIVGAVAAKLVGGDAKTGASVAASETKNNWLGHEQYDFAKELKAALASGDEAKMKDIIARYYALSNYNEQNGLTGEGDDQRITGALYPALDNLISEEDKYWLSRGLNYTLDKMVNTDPEMFNLANEYRNKLDQNRLPETQYSSLDDAINATDKNTNNEVEQTSYETKDPNGDDYIVAIQSTVGAAFTSPFLKVASALYQQSLYGKGETQYFNSGSLVSNAIEDSISFKGQIKELAKNVPIGTTQYYSSSVNMRDNNDNILAFGNIKLSVAITVNEDGSINVNGKAKDLYNFEHQTATAKDSLKKQAVVLINNNAATLQEKGIIHPYVWEADIDTTIWN